MCDLRGNFKDLFCLRDRMCEKSKCSFLCTFRGNRGCKVGNLPRDSVYIAVKLTYLPTGGLGKIH